MYETESFYLSYHCHICQYPLPGIKDKCGKYDYVVARSVRVSAWKYNTIQSMYTLNNQSDVYLYSLNMEEWQDAIGFTRWLLSAFHGIVPLLLRLLLGFHFCQTLCFGASSFRYVRNRMRGRGGTYPTQVSNTPNANIMIISKRCDGGHIHLRRWWWWERVEGMVVPFLYHILFVFTSCVVCFFNPRGHPTNF